MLGTLLAIGLFFGLSVARAYRRQKADVDAYRPEGLRWTREPE